MTDVDCVDETQVVQESVRLKEGFLLKDLVDNLTTEFTLDARNEGEEPESERRVDTCYDFNDFSPFINLECLQASETGVDPKTPFDIIREQMASIVKDGGVMKKVKREGSGGVVPENAVIYIHYNSYFEMEEVPFDTSYLRTQKPLRFQLGKGTMYPGFEVAVSTMKKGELSQFIVEPEYAFGKMGVPPRIPQNATILLEVEMINFIDCGDATIAASLEGKKIQFPEIYKSAKAFHALANDYFLQKNIPAASDNYRKAERLLTSCRMSTDEEERDQKKLLLKIYVNLCICYNDAKMKNPRKVCQCAKDAVFTCPKETRTNAKLHYNWGKALLMLGEFKKAGEHLRLALKVQPNNSDICKLLETLETKEKKFREHERICFQKALQLDKNDDSAKKEVEKASVGDFEAMLRQQLEEFKRGTSSRIQLPSGLTQEERQRTREVTQELGLSYQEQVVQGSISGSTIITIIKN